MHTGKLVHLRYLGFCNLCGKQATDSFPLIMNCHHHLRGLVHIHYEEFLQYLHHKIHGGVTDGFDMGVAALSPVIGKSDTERRIMLNTIAPHWDGNQVWLITAGGALFAAWPLVYATSFSGFYFAMYATLAALWLRPLALDYRSKIEDPKWRKTWDYALCFSGTVPPIIFGVAFGNLLQGVPFDLNEFMMSKYHGTFFALLNP